MTIDESSLNCRYTKKDAIIACILAIIILALAFFNLYPSCIWGDDFAAYISEGMAIVNGNLPEQAEKNFLMHPDHIFKEAHGSLVYVWGYPLMLGLVYKLVGFDPINFGCIFFYKIPGAICFAGFAATIYLFLRRRFKTGTALILSTFLCCMQRFYNNINFLMSDVPYLFFATLCILLIEIYFSLRERKTKLGGMYTYSVILGFVLWFTYELRLNGITLTILFVVCHIVYLIKQKKLKKDEIFLNLLPYLVFFALKFVFEYLILLPATGNSSDFEMANFGKTISNISGNIIILKGMIEGVLSSAVNLFAGRLPEGIVNASLSLCKIFGTIFTVMAPVGIAFCGIKKDLHLSVYLVVSFLATCLLPYGGDSRYMFPLVPLIVLFSAMGVRFLWNWAKRKLHICGKIGILKNRIFAAAVTAVMCLAFITPIVKLDKNNVETILTRAKYIDPVLTREFAYTPTNADMYKWIIENTPADAEITFKLSRTIYLNTGRITYRPGDRIKTEYFLAQSYEYYFYRDAPDQRPKWFDSLSDYAVEYENPDMILMKRIEGR